MSHTPGPWVVRQPEDGELHEVYAENGGELICFPVFTQNQRHNVPLIAAAPELLDALKSLFADWVTLVGEDLKEQSDDVSLLWKNCEEVISKAEGRSE
jgi:hypothetical protein